MSVAEASESVRMLESVKRIIFSFRETFRKMSYRLGGVMGAGGRWLDPRSGHTKDFKTGSNGRPPLRCNLPRKRRDITDIVLKVA